MKRPKYHNLINRRFSKLLVGARAGKDKSGCILWSCQCDCGKTATIRTGALVNRKHPQVSCGCHRDAGLALWHEKRKLPQGQAALNRLFLSYRRNAIKSGTAFSLSKIAFMRLTTLPCRYCGTPPKQKVAGAKNGDFIHNGLDRLTPKLGYIETNVCPCCKTCNIAKHTMTEQEFYTWIERVYRLKFSRSTPQDDQQQP